MMMMDFSYEKNKLDVICQICGLRTRSKNGQKRVFMAQYPKDPELAKKWVKVTGKEDLAYYPLESLRRKFVCRYHFCRSDFKPSLTCLKPEAVPSLRLTQDPLPDDILAEFPLPAIRGCDGKILAPTPILYDVSIKELHDHDYCINNVRENSTLLYINRTVSASESSIGQRKESTENHIQASHDLTSDTPETYSIESDNTQSPNEPLNNVKSTNSEPKAHEKGLENNPIHRWLQHPRNHKLTIESGLNTTLLTELKQKTVNDIGKKGKTCVLLFDEIKLQEHVYYNSYLGKVVGYVDLGEEGGRGKELANCALVFVLENVLNYQNPSSQYPIAHYFYKDEISKEKLSNILKTIIKSVRKAGYMLIASICEDKQTFIDVLNLLKGESDNPDDLNYYLVDNEKVFIIYDVPRIFMTIRNNLIQYGELVMDSKKLKWSHLVMAQEKNNSIYNFYKLKSHENKIDWTRNGIKLAIQIFSNTMAAMLKLLSESVDNILNEEEIFQAGEVIEYLDRLFDCTNGFSGSHDIKKHRKHVTKNSTHHDLWIEYKRILNNSNFHIDDFHYLYNIRCMKSYITTISSLQDVWKYFLENDFKILNLRKFNLDILYTIFGSSMEDPFNSVTCFDIEVAVNAHTPKISIPSLESNHTNDNILLHKFVNKPSICIKTDLELRHLFSRFNLVPIVYMSGYCSSVILKNENCEKCYNALNAPEVNYIDKCSLLKKSWRERVPLAYPSNNLCVTIVKALKAFELDVQPVLHIKNILNYSVMTMLNKCDSTWMCREHRNAMIKKLFQHVSYLLIRNNCRLKNESLMERISKQINDES